METIRAYIETMFKGVEATAEIRDLKEEISSNMQERYRELKAQGKSENEAIGAVISEFGNIDELLSEMGYQAEGSHKNEEERPMAKREEVLAYIQDSKVLGRRVGLGVGLIIWCAAGVILSEALVEFFAPGSSLDAIAMIVLIMGVCVAVGTFIYNGLKMEKYKALESGQMRLDSVTISFLEEELKQHKNGHNIRIVAGVVLCIFALIPTMIGEWIMPLSIGEDIGTSIMLLLVAIGVYLFITTGVVTSAYEGLIRKNKARGDEKYLDEDYDHAEAESAKAAKWIGRVHSIMWPIVMGIYLYLGFVRNLWHPGWVVFPIAGVLSSVIAVVVNILTERKK
jgi:hypothetical protein